VLPENSLYDNSVLRTRLSSIWITPKVQFIFDRYESKLNCSTTFNVHHQYSVSWNSVKFRTLCFHLCTFFKERIKMNGRKWNVLHNALYTTLRNWKEADNKQHTIHYHIGPEKLCLIFNPLTDKATDYPPSNFKMALRLHLLRRGASYDL